MKTALALIAAVIVIAAFGWVSAFKALSEWCDKYVGSSTVAIAIKEVVKVPSPVTMTIRQLKAIASERGVKGYGRMSKAALIEVVMYSKRIE